MDFEQFRAQMAKQFPEEDVNLSNLKRIRAVRFDVDERGYVSGTADGNLVYRHRDSEADINAGEIWVCELLPNPQQLRQFFAKGIVKVDSSFLYDLTREQLLHLANKVWKDNRDLIEGIILEENRGIIDERVQKGIENAIEEYQSRIEELEAKVSRLTQEKENLDGMLSMSDSLIDDLKEEVAKQKEIVSGCQNEIIQLNIRMKNARKTIPQAGKVEYVVRTQPDTLYSRSFEDGTYSVFLNAEKTAMLIERNENGRVECKDGMMRLGGLNDILPFDFVQTYGFTVDNRGKMHVSLTCAEA